MISERAADEKMHRDWRHLNALWIAATKENERLRAREDRLLRIAIDATWGEALEDGSVPATKKQDWIIAYARAELDRTADA